MGHQVFPTVHAAVWTCLSCTRSWCDGPSLLKAPPTGSTMFRQDTVSRSPPLKGTAKGTLLNFPAVESVSSELIA